MSLSSTRKTAARRDALRFRGATTAALAAVAALSGCAGQQPVHFHSLLPPPPSVSASREPAAPASPAAAGGQREAARGVAWRLAPVSVPAGVERPQWVVRAPDGTLAVLENERWIAPLADDLHAALAERLTQSLGAEEGAAPAAGRPAWRIAVDVRRFESDPARAARLDVAWSVEAAGAAARRAPLACTGRFEQSVGSGYPALAAGHRQALARLADALAATVRALDRDAAAAVCPDPSGA